VSEKPQMPPSVHALVSQLEMVFQSRPVEAFARLGGAIEIMVIAEGPIHFTATLVHGVVRVTPGAPAAPVLRFGIERFALQWLIDGSLDAPRAFRERRLAIEAEPDVLDRFGDLMAPALKLIPFRAARAASSRPASAPAYLRSAG